MKLKIESNSLTPATIASDDLDLLAKIDELNTLISEYYQDLDFYRFYEQEFNQIIIKLQNYLSLYQRDQSEKVIDLFSES